VLVAKHCSGFLCWQSDCYPYGVRQSRWRDGKGDVVRDYVESCRRARIQPGIYASVSANAWWEVNNPGLVNWGKGGDEAKQKAYVRACEQMLTELWGNYGPLFEIWFDGGALPQDQGGPDLLPILRRLQPRATVFQGPAATIRWIGNEKGVASYPCWATVQPGVDVYGAGDPQGSVWLPGECDVPIRNHYWFWHPDQEQTIYSLDALMDMYLKSVGRNCNLLINANIDRNGLVPQADLQRYREFGDEIRRRFGTALGEISGRGSEVLLQLPRPGSVDCVITMETNTEGERVREYVIEGQTGAAWTELCRGQSVGHKRIDTFPATEVWAIRWRCLRSEGEPVIRRLAAHGAAQ
jgi:alpha-L-fucosidase